jgi:thiol:disulfide interchange protein
MAATAVACAWLLFRQTGQRGLLIAVAAAALLGLLLWLVGRVQRRGTRGAWVPALLAMAVVGAAVWQAPARSDQPAVRAGNSERWSPQRVEAYVAQGRPVLVNFTADWCLTCKANEVAAIDREAVQAAFKRNGVKVLVADWTNGDPEITRFLESRGRAGVPLYLWYKAGQQPEELPQILTPAMLISRARSAPPARP